jgi:integrase
LRGEPGTAQFHASYNEAVARKATGPQGTILSLLDGYQQSTAFIDLRERTKADYKQKITQIEERFADFPLAALSDRRTRGIFMTWRDQIAVKSRRQADYAWQVLALILQWALDRGTITHNPCARGGRLYRSGVRIEKIWTHEHEAAFLRLAPAHLHLPLLLGLWTAQREGDLLRLPWASYDGATIKLRQSKTGASMVIPVGVPLALALDATKKRCLLILTNSRGRPWTSHAFQAAFGAAARSAGVSGLTFHDLRGSAITRLALAGSSEAEIATLSGHSLSDVRTVLEKFYLHRGSEARREREMAE